MVTTMRWPRRDSFARGSAARLVSWRQEKRFAEVVRAIALASDPQWQREHAHIIEAVCRLPRGNR